MLRHHPDIKWMKHTFFKFKKRKKNNTHDMKSERATYTNPSSTLTPKNVLHPRWIGIVAAVSFSVATWLPQISTWYNVLYNDEKDVPAESIHIRGCKPMFIAHLWQ